MQTDHAGVVITEELSSLITSNLCKACLHDWQGKDVCVACRSLMVREGQLLETDTLSELGIFGAFLRRGNKVLLNKEAGHLIRTKVCAICQTLIAIAEGTPNLV